MVCIVNLLKSGEGTPTIEELLRLLVAGQHNVRPGKELSLGVTDGKRIVCFDGLRIVHTWLKGSPDLLVVTTTRVIRAYPNR